MSKPTSYLDVADQWRREQLPQNENQRRWQRQQDAEDLARELIAGYLRDGVYVDCRPTAQQRAAIDEAHKLAGTKPDWTAIRRAANERALRAAGLEYRDEVKRAEQAADERGD